MLITLITLIVVVRCQHIRSNWTVRFLFVDVLSLIQDTPLGLTDVSEISGISSLEFLLTSEKGGCWREQVGRP